MAEGAGERVLRGGKESPGARSGQRADANCRQDRRRNICLSFLGVQNSFDGQQRVRGKDKRNCCFRSPTNFLWNILKKGRFQSFPYLSSRKPNKECHKNILKEVKKKTGSLSSLAFQNEEQELKVAKQRETWANALRNEKNSSTL